MVKKVLTWGGVAFLIYFIAYNPQGAANVAKAIGSGLWSLGDGIGEFFSSLVE
ncbi:MAG TPA: hypothetical protein VJM32_02525 [Candidatus Saccharimonadales bacterium]|nr:hypothetical protein [Candidatus Saccharimonadales bacterium]